MTPIVLSIGTTHPWNVAGVGRDLVVGAEFGVRVFTAVAAVSAQDGARRNRAPCDSCRRAFAAQLAALPWDSAGAVRIGALPTLAAVRAVAEPLTVASVAPGGRRSGLYREPRRRARRFVRALRRARRARNSSQRRADAEPRRGRLSSREVVDRAATRSARRRPRCEPAARPRCLLKGGHLDGEPADALATAAGVEIFSEPRIAGAMHGTGCTLAMALACELAGGTPIARRGTCGARVRSRAARKALTAHLVTFTRE